MTPLVDSRWGRERPQTPGSEGALLAGKRALVTGGSRGLGSAICRAFAAEGANVAFTFARDEAAATALTAELEGKGVKSRAFSHDGAAGGPKPQRAARAFKVSVTDEPATGAMVKAIEDAWGAIDILVCNAGVSQNLPLALLEEEDFDHVMDINVKGAYLTSRAVLRGMIRRKSGAVLQIGSLAGTRMIEAPIHYTASKAAITGLTLALAKEVARHGIRVNCLAPGLLEGGVGKNLPDYRLADYLKHCALGRVGTFDEVARFAAFLVSDRNSFMTGETIVMDGGV